MEFRIGRKVRPTNVIILWLMEHASQGYFGHSVGRDGRTPVECNRDRQVTRPVCEFGKQVLHMTVKAGRGRKFDDRFLHGTCPR
eukprot:1942163-Heterocapsa_arctica.AAC.1